MTENGDIPIVGTSTEVLCPHCKEVLVPNTATAEFDTGHIAQIFYCDGCKAVISIQLVGQKQQPKKSILISRPLKGLKQ